MPAVKRDVNDVLLLIGDVGRYQLLTFFWSFFAIAISACMHLHSVFTSAEMEFTCADLVWKEFHNLTGNASTTQCYLAGNESIKCSQFSYSSPIFKNTIVSQFNLVCDREYLLTLTNTLYLSSVIFTSFGANIINDFFGRKKCVIICCVIFAVSGVGQAYAVNITMYMVFRMLGSLPVVGVYDGLASLTLEATSPLKRVRLVLGLVFFWGAGVMLLSPIAFAFRDAKYLTLAISIPAAVVAVASIWILDESPHWLYSKGKLIEAQKIINKIANWNKFKGNASQLELSYLPEDAKVHSSNDDVEIQESCCDVFSAKWILLRLFLANFCWLAHAMGYTGLSFGVSSLGGNVYINNFIGGAVEIVSYIIAFSVLFAGRQKIFIILSAIGGCGLILAALFENFLPHVVGLSITATMVGRLSVSACWQILFMWTLEMYPTSLRNILKAVSQTAGNVGSACSPLLNDSYKYIRNPNIRGKMIAPMVYGILVVVAAVMAAFLPETNNKPLPIIIKDANKRSLDDLPTAHSTSSESLESSHGGNPFGFEKEEKF